MCAEIKIQKGLGARREKDSLYLGERMEPRGEWSGVTDTDAGLTLGPCPPPCPLAHFPIKYSLS